jgi:hypothetical protein
MDSVLISMDCHLASPARPGPLGGVSVRYTVTASGLVLLAVRVRLPDTLPTVARVGLRLRLADDLDQVSHTPPGFILSPPLLDRRPCLPRTAPRCSSWN